MSVQRQLRAAQTVKHALDCALRKLSSVPHYGVSQTFRSLAANASARRDESLTAAASLAGHHLAEAQTEAASRQAHKQRETHGHSSLLYIGPSWPEPSSTAAGVRTRDLITTFSRAWDVHFLSPSAFNQHSQALEASGVTVHRCPANRAEQFIRVLKQVQPQVCVFDRFYTEEAFSFLVHRHAPNCLRILDMQDLHALRQGRMEQHAAGATPEEVIAHRPDARSTALQRELASIHRSDLALVCSPVELALLRDTYMLPAHKLRLAPFFMPPPDSGTQAPPGYGARRHFVSIGNFKHPPNMDSVQWLATELWDVVRERLGDAEVELHLYGAYPSAAAQRLHDPARKLIVKGHMPSLQGLLSYRVLLAPLRFGAGLKGKIVDAWSHGMPVVTTPIGSEGMTAQPYVDPVHEMAIQLKEDPIHSMIAQPEAQPQQLHLQWGGFGAAVKPADLAAQAAQLYSNEELWQQCQETGLHLQQELFGWQRLDGILLGLQEGRDQLLGQRHSDYVGSMLWAQGNRATEFFSRWIELKETQKANEVAAAQSASSALAGEADETSHDSVGK